MQVAARTMREVAESQPMEIVHSDAIRAMCNMSPFTVDVVFADPPYFLSGGGSTCKGGKRASVNKGGWDQPKTPEEQLEWTRGWLFRARRILKPTGTIWIFGTMHSVPTTGYALQLEGFRLLNTIAWEKGNPPPNLGCRCFTHSHETIMWASLGPKAKHHFDYDWAKAENGGKQMKDVWRFNAPPASEKTHGKHPTQKPVELVRRCLMASAPEGGLVVDPFAGSGTTGVAALRCNRDLGFVGIEREQEWCDLARRRIEGENVPAREDAAAGG